MATVNPAPSPSLTDASIRLTTEFTIRLTPFDQKEYRKLIEARAATVQRVVAKLKPVLGLASAVDAGCGMGFFSQTLAEAGLNVCGFDGRAENVEEARRRFPKIPFEQADIQDTSILQLGRFDIVLCFGLLYHLENPLLAVRHLRAMTGKCLLVESMCLPETRTSMMLREEPRQSDQSLSDVAWCPSESSLVKMLYRAGYRVVYKVLPLPDHDDFRETPEHARRRTVLLASSMPIDVAGFRLFPEPFETADPWAKKAVARPALPTRIARFLGSPARRQYLTVAHRARRIFPGMAIPLRLPFKAWWLAEKSALDHELMYNEFESAEMGFVQKLLRPGMTVLDVGAHHGLYTLLAAKKVGRYGRVIAFEASPRECRRLERHVRFNRCSNVHIERCAVGSESGEADLFLVDGFQDWCNSLRRPDVPDPTYTVRVRVRRTDAVLAERRIAKVDFIKLDVEGFYKGRRSFYKALRVRRFSRRYRTFERARGAIRRAKLSSTSLGWTIAGSQSPQRARCSPSPATKNPTTQT
jgi:FkbM family methyltransferase